MTPLINCDNYYLSPSLEVWSCVSGKWLKSYIGPNGYPYVTLKGRGREYLHRIVAKIFVPNPDGKPEVNHKDGNRSNYFPSNLEWVTASENLKHSYEVLGRKEVASYKHPNQKLSDKDILAIYNSSGSESSVARKYGTSRRTVGNIRKGIRHTRITKGGCAS